jgi:hypothetical protein
LHSYKLQQNLPYTHTHTHTHTHTQHSIMKPTKHCLSKWGRKREWKYNGGSSRYSIGIYGIITIKYPQVINLCQFKYWKSLVFFFFFLWHGEFELRASRLLGRCSSLEPLCQPWKKFLRIKGKILFSIVYIHTQPHKDNIQCRLYTCVQIYANFLLRLTA